MLVGITRSFLQPSIHNTFSLCRFLIEEGSSTRLVHPQSDSLSRLVASERFGISFNLEEKFKFIFLRFARDYMYQTRQMRKNTHGAFSIFQKKNLTYTNLDSSPELLKIAEYHTELNKTLGLKCWRKTFSGV